MSDVDDLAAFGDAALRSDGGALTTADERDAITLPELVPRNSHAAGFVSEAREEDADSVAPASKQHRPKRSAPPTTRVERAAAEKSGDTSPPDDDDCERVMSRGNTPPVRRPFIPAHPRAPLLDIPYEPAPYARPAVMTRAPLLPTPVTMPQTKPSSSSFSRAASPDDAISQFDRNWEFLMEHKRDSTTDMRQNDVVAHLKIFKDNFRVMHAQMEGDNPWEKAMQYVLMVMGTTQRVVENTQPRMEKMDEEVRALMPPIVSHAKKTAPETSQKVRSPPPCVPQVVLPPASTKATSLPSPSPAPAPAPKQVKERAPSSHGREMSVPHRTMNESTINTKLYGTAGYDTEDSASPPVQKGWIASLFS